MSLAHCASVKRVFWNWPIAWPKPGVLARTSPWRQRTLGPIHRLHADDEALARQLAHHLHKALAFQTAQQGVCGTRRSLKNSSDVSPACWPIFPGSGRA